MIVLYIGLFLSLSGTLDKLSGRLTSDPSGASSSGPGMRMGPSAVAGERSGKEVRGVAKKMLW